MTRFPSVMPRPVRQPSYRDRARERAEAAPPAWPPVAWSRSVPAVPGRGTPRKWALRGSGS